MLLDGKKTALKRNEHLKMEINEIVSKNNRKPKLSIILVGENPASLSYIKGKKRACEMAGIMIHVEYFEYNASSSDILTFINSQNNDSSIDGIILQLPVPQHLDEELLLNAIAPQKDVDGFSFVNKGHLFAGKYTSTPATPTGIINLLLDYNIEITSKNVVVIGRSNIVGLPVAKMLLDLNATITICHSKTKDLSNFTKTADILIVAIGKPRFVTVDMVKKGCIVIDVGINRINGKIVGDVDFDNVSKIVEYITPVPGGVGPMTINALLENTIKNYKKNTF